MASLAAPPAMSGRFVTAGAFVRTRWLAARLRTCADVAAWQHRRIAALDRHLVCHIPFYRDRADRPVIDKAAMLANFAAMNVAGITADAVRAALAGGLASIDGYEIGQSTGTSGNRGFYVLSDRERYVWLGTILAKALPDALWRRHRVALALPGISGLYRSAASGSRIAIGAFDLAEGVDSWLDRLVDFAPDTIVAPPKVLRLLAEAGRLSAAHVFSGGEVLDPLDRAIIERASGATVREIYMATEGLFGVACPHGTLHLAEDAVRFEWEPAAPDGPLALPIVTDFTRRAQAMVRYRMNDLLTLADRPCPCGSPLAAVERIEGRRDDMCLLATPGGMLRPVTPDVLRNAVVDADLRITDFRIAQTGAGALAVTLPSDLPPDVDAAVRAGLAAVAARLHLAPLSVTIAHGIAPVLDRKLRRVVRAWQPDQRSTSAV